MQTTVRIWTYLFRSPCQSGGSSFSSAAAMAAKESPEGPSQHEWLASGLGQIPIAVAKADETYRRSSELFAC